MTHLKRSHIINGREHTEEVEIPQIDKAIAPDGKIRLRTLTDGEFAHIIAVGKDVGNVNMDMDETTKTSQDEDMELPSEQNRRMQMNINPRLQEEAAYESDCLCASYGLSNGGEVWAVEDVKELRPIGIVTEIAKAVIKISRLDDPENLESDVRNFREEKSPDGD